MIEKEERYDDDDYLVIKTSAEIMQDVDYFLEGLIQAVLLHDEELVLEYIDKIKFMVSELHNNNNMVDSNGMKSPQNY